MVSITAVAISPDGKSVYATSLWNDAVSVFDRAADGTLTQKATLAGCASEGGAGGCTPARALDEPSSVTVSPGGTSVYVTSRQSNAVAVFDRAQTARSPRRPTQRAASTTPEPSAAPTARRWTRPQRRP